LLPLTVFPLPSTPGVRAFGPVELLTR
jgi:hypothetical protein